MKVTVTVTVTVILVRIESERTRVANREHAVVQIGAAIRIVEYATSVKLETGLVGLDRDRDRGHGDRVHERGLVVRGHVLEAVNVAHNARRGVGPATRVG